MFPILLIIASLAFGAPSALSAEMPDQMSQNPDNLHAYVEQYFSDTPILARIAWCESTDRQFNKDGSILRGTVDKDDVGVMQINTRYHEEKALAMDMDLYTLHGNLGYAKYLYAKEGLKPWLHSAPCWAKMAVK
jgi:hypothetical protein